MPFDLVADDDPGVNFDDVEKLILEILPPLVKKSVDDGIRAALYLSTGYTDFGNEELTLEQALKNWEHYHKKRKR